MSLILLSGTATALAGGNDCDSWDSDYCYESCDCCCEPQPNQCLDTYGYNPPYYDLNCACGISIEVDFLYWYGRERDLEWGYRVAIIPESPGNDQVFETVLDKVLYPDASWDPGVRVALGWSSCCDGWDLNLAWTYYKNSRRETFSVTPQTGAVSVGDLQLINPWTDDAGAVFDRINSKWEFRYNQLDLVLGRRYWTSPCFILRPFGGLRFLWTDTEFTSSSSSDPSLGAISSVLRTQAGFEFENKYWGIGVVGGVQPRFYFTPCFSLYSGFAVSLVWGEFDVDRAHAFDQVFVTSVGEEQGALYSYSSDSEVSGMQTVFDVEIGLRYEIAFCDRSYLGYMEAGWEHHALLNHVTRAKAVSSQPPFDMQKGDVVFGGFVLKAGFQF